VSRAERSSHAERAERYGGDLADLLFEDALKACRREGHDWEPRILQDGREAAECRRCEAWMEEVE
jgi:hypothetical protein